ncbi:MAG: DUF308 domain-containing protein [Actinobacteria bacterium]|nr:DUF308 domain-containing protein [Actinomycetota bacterium]
MGQVYTPRGNWWSFLLTGILATALGVLLLAWPGISLLVLILAFGIFAVVEGTIDSARAITHAMNKENWGLLMAKGLVGLLIGIVLIARPDATLPVIIILIAAWMVVTGFIRLIIAFELPPDSGKGMWYFSGVVSLVAGILLIAVPLETVKAVVVFVAVMALILGIATISLTFYLLVLKSAGQNGV